MQVQEKLFSPEILCTYIDLVHFAMEALDIYTINVNPNQQRASGLISRSKEEKEVLEHFSGIVNILEKSMDITICLLCIFQLKFLSVSHDALAELPGNICNHN